MQDIHAIDIIIDGSESMNNSYRCYTIDIINAKKADNLPSKNPHSYCTQEQGLQESTMLKKYLR